MTGSALDLGLVGLAQFFPLVALMLVAGQVADRYDRKTVICISQVVDGLAMGILALGTCGRLAHPRRDLGDRGDVRRRTRVPAADPTESVAAPCPSGVAVACGGSVFVLQPDCYNCRSGDRRHLVGRQHPAGLCALRLALFCRRLSLDHDQGRTRCAKPRARHLQYVFCRHRIYPAAAGDPWLHHA